MVWRGNETASSDHEYVISVDWGNTKVTFVLPQGSDELVALTHYFANMSRFYLHLNLALNPNIRWFEWDACILYMTHLSSVSVTVTYSI